MTFVPADSNENGQPQVPPVHISHTALIEDPARKQRWQRQQQAQSPRQRAAALHVPSHSHSEGNGGGSNPMSPVSTEFSSRYRGAVSKSPRYPVTAPGGVVLTTAQAAHAMHSHVPLPPMSSELSSSTTSDRPETPPIRVWSPFSGRRRLTNASARSTSSRASSIFSELSDFTSGSSSWTEKDNDDDCSGPLRQGYEIRPVEFPKPAALRRTHISPPIRSIMSVSNEEGDILGRQDIFIRMEEDKQYRSSDDDENSDYTSDRNGRRYEQQESEYHYKTMTPCSNQSRYRGSEDSYFSRQNSHSHHLPNQLHSSTSTLSRQGHHHHHHRYHQHQQSLYNSRRSSMIQTGLCPSIVPPPIPRIPQEYISSEESSISRGSSLLSSSLSSSPPIGYDPEWVDTVGERDEYHDDEDGGVYMTHEANWRRRSSSGRRVSRGTGRKGNEVSKPMSRSLMKAVRHERGWSSVSPALSVTQASEWALSRELERVASNSSSGGSGSGGRVGGSSVEEVEGGYHDERQQQRHVGMEYY
ncbi:hypothetical protein BGZ97_010244 [Linnemannia gamsii]|uniref:Uncharacterized protein n=1 Tax=Linnemannia gamsii TaxID=64522 RepID=A0A9P6RM99_9FUNG|nr:hypothetical protein BGZ97_010244 [Linnemannia gamsii]